MSGSPQEPDQVASDPRAFGQEIARIRESKGFTQAEVTGRVSAYYGDVSAYRRIELGTRTPSRDAAMAILRHGVRLNVSAEINAGLALLAYAPLEPDEVRDLQVRTVPNLEPPVIPPAMSRKRIGWIRLAAAAGSKPRRAIAAGICLTAAIAIATGIRNEATITFLNASLYAALFAISVLLESVYQPSREGVEVAAAVTFAVMLLSSLSAFAVDSWLVGIGSSAGLISALTIFCLAALGQWLMVRTVLSPQSVVSLRFQSHTAQAAHLKNTFYFLLIGVIFWLPPAHCVAVLRRELGLGHNAFVRQIRSEHFMVGKSVVCFDPIALLCLLAVMIGAAVLMGSRLLDSIRPDRRHNTYSLLLYARAALCLILSIVCLGWYADSLCNLSN